MASLGRGAVVADALDKLITYTEPEIANRAFPTYVKYLQITTVERQEKHCCGAFSLADKVTHKVLLRIKSESNTEVKLILCGLLKPLILDLGPSFVRWMTRFCDVLDAITRDPVCAVEALEALQLVAKVLEGREHWQPHVKPLLKTSRLSVSGRKDQIPEPFKIRMP